MNPLKPTPSLLAKLGSLAVHVEEMFSETGHAFDRAAIQSILDDYEVKNWIAAMSQAGMLPVKRTAQDLVESLKRGTRRGRKKA